MSESDDDIPVKDLGGEVLEVDGSGLVDKVKELAAGGVAKRLHITNEAGERLITVPLPMGAAGLAATVLLAPTLAAVAAIGALVAKARIEIEST